ncbi:unknown [Clostridium sp. CAG:967]|nr:unknown [Clostridium sp. CAG:967]
MKKFFVFLLCLIQLQGFCATNTSNNTFDITISDIPPGRGGKSGGLSGGAVTAITLGSIFSGLAAGGVGYYFYKKGTCLTGACVWDKSNPLIPICGDRKKVYIDNNYPHLKRAIENEDICLDCSKKKYIFIKDSAIKNKTFSRFYFKNEDFTNIKIIQYSKPFKISNNIPELDTKIFLEDKEIALSTEKMNAKEGILIKKGRLSKNMVYFADTSFVGKDAKYIFAIILEFEK